MAYPQLRRPDEDRHRRRRRQRRLVISFFLFIALVVFLESPLTRIRHLVVSGNRDVPADRVVRASGLRPGMSLWQVNGSAVSAQIAAALPLVERVQVTVRPLRGEVDLRVEEKHVVAIARQGGRYFRVLNDGTVYDEITPEDGFRWPVLTVAGLASVTPGRTLGDGDAVSVCRQLARLHEADVSRVSEIDIDRFGVATIYLIDGFAGQVAARQLAARFSTLLAAVSYFAQHGYRPGVVDLTGQPPYRYTPFRPSGTGGVGGG
ncbi:hypothetical protein GCM10010885_03530 [Alicyclobacillus cellulosilyticus]|uniref:POTRA domain-containing protein n=1 Tax=Alicyclobacillus cellulosilyticus TaxID=1003997 RepID=A0A917K4L1_9BACL|nr:FtsQ-type POTRA domain-containing protein [Alicyclobacillus cellulosilyticus]GGI97252.1 hypothetical protein GCM10010885_03530 [Alicyclobacillus cellulosilyticus]